MYRTGIALCLVAVLSACVAAPTPPGTSQLAQSVSVRMLRYGIEVPPEVLSERRAAALHLTLVSPRGYYETQRRLENILRSSDYP